MVIAHNLAAMSATRMFHNVLQAQASSFEKLSSGYRINRAADDPAGLSISERMRAQIRGLNQATRNLQDGISFLQTAEGGLIEVNDILLRMKELSVQAQTGTYNSIDLTNIGLEMKELMTGIEEIYDNTKFNGIRVYDRDNDFSTATKTTDIVYGESGQLKLSIEDLQTEKVRAIIDRVKQTDFTTDPAQIKAISGSMIDQAINEVASGRGKYGAKQNRMEHTINYQNNYAENLQAAESRIRDVDIAKEVMELTKNNILAQAIQAILAQSFQQQQMVLQLLR